MYTRRSPAPAWLNTRAGVDLGMHACSACVGCATVVVVVVEILFRIADQTGRFAQYYDGDIIREVNSKEMKCLVHVVYHQ